MKRTYQLLGYLLLGIGTYALINAGNTNLQATAPATQQQTPRKRNRHTITLVLSQLSDLKVEEGQRINVGDVISDRLCGLPCTAERTKLQAKQQRLSTSLSRTRLPLNELKPVPVPKFQTELVALKQAQFNLDAIVSQINNFSGKFYHKDPWHVQVFASGRTRRYRLHQKQGS